MRKPQPLVEIVGTGRYLPDGVLTNDDLAKKVDTSDEWIHTRTGIRERRIAPEGVNAADMGAAAARRAMERAQIDPGEVDVLANRGDLRPPQQGPLSRDRPPLAS